MYQSSPPMGALIQAHGFKRLHLMTLHLYLRSLYFSPNATLQMLPKYKTSKVEPLTFCPKHSSPSSSVNINSLLPVAETKQLGVISDAPFSHTAPLVCQQILMALLSKYIRTQPFLPFSQSKPQSLPTWQMQQSPALPSSSHINQIMSLVSLEPAPNFPRPIQP